MLETLAKPEKRKLWFQKSFTTERARYCATYSPIPARYSGMPNYLKYCIGPGAELKDADLSLADLRWSNFRGANLKGADLKESVLWGSILTQADLTDADLSYADLTGVDLVGANLENAKLEGACFLGARYSPETRFPKGFGDPEKRGLVSLCHSMQLGGCHT